MQIGEFAAMDRLQIETRAGQSLREEESGSADTPHIRSYFPEALYINPEIITDRKGRASIVIPMADSITTWRMAMIEVPSQVRCVPKS